MYFSKFTYQHKDLGTLFEVEQRLLDSADLKFKVDLKMKEAGFKFTSLNQWEASQ